MRISLSQAIQSIQEGIVIGVPTETVYGLAAALHQIQAVQKIFTLKGRPLNNPLIIHLANPQELRPFCSHSLPHLNQLIETFWPGPLTVVVPINTTLIPEIPRAGLTTAAFRIPQHPLALELIAKTGPLVMPSANLSGKPSSTLADHLEQDFGSDFPILDGGPCQRGLESTILYYDQEKWKIIREGALAAQDFSPILGYLPFIETKKTEAPLCPGQMYRHYAPKAQLRLTTEFNSDMEGVVLGFSGRNYPSHCKVIELGDLAKPASIAENLYHHFRQLDQEGIAEAFIDMHFKPEGLLSTIKERIERAASL